MLKKGIIPLKQIYEVSTLINVFILNTNVGHIINPISHDMILKADPYNKPAILIMAISLLRYSDASNLLFIKKELPDNLIYQQGKTERYVLLNFSVIPKDIREKIVTLNKTFEVFNYVRISNYIRNYNDNFLGGRHYTFNSKTHFFRHLEVSYRKSLGYSKEYLEKKLGHIDTKAQSCYIHKELINLFLKQTE